MAQLIIGTDGQKSHITANRTSYQYPLDVDSKSSSHFIQFQIRVRQQATINYGSGAVDATRSGGNEYITVPRPPRKTLDSTIQIQMPPTIEVSHKINYADTEIGLLVAGLLAAGQSFSDDISADAARDAITNSIGGEIKNAITGLAEGIGITGARAANQISSGKVINNRTELKFEGIDRRAFAFTFRMLPKSSEEAQIIKEIVTLFRYHAMPNFPIGGSLGGRTMEVPSTFDISYVPGRHLHKIDECALESVQVKYGGERTQFFVDDQPVETELTLQFRELGIITKEKIAEGF
tara:strand:- start:2599 stop:3477 length:879 start_codon:yes stop_codon:yes gene_type:complete